jgi:putative intracellular protease/amidase
MRARGFSITLPPKGDPVTKPNRTVHLVGGGPGAILQMRRHFKAALAAVGKKPLVAYVGAASGDHAGFQAMVSAALTGARVEAAKLVSKRASTATARQLLEDCDLAFFSGGDVWRGMRVLEERDVVSLLRRLADDGKPMLGVSAGSIMLARAWVNFPDDDDDKAELFECVGAAPVYIDCHSEDDGWSELRTLVTLLHRRGDKDTTAYGVPSRGCLRVEVGDGKPQLQALGEPVPRLKARRGQVVEDGALAVA